MIRFSGLALFFSGMSSLVLQFIWLRLLGTTHSFSTTTIALILLAFFAGLASGSILAQWRLKLGQNGLSGFMWSQLLVAISSCLLLPVLISPESFINFLPNQQMDSLTGFLAIFLILFIPTSAMGMSFPFFTAWLAERKQYSDQVISSLFSLSLFGGVVGVLLAGFYLIPNLGLNGSVYAAAAFSGLAVLIALIIKNQVTEIEPQHPPAPIPQSSGQLSKYLVVIAATGFSLMGSEIVWIKFLGIYTGTTLFGFSAIMAVLLMGLASGALIIHRWQKTKQLGLNQLFILLIALSITLNLTRTALGYLPSFYGQTNYLGELLHSKDALFFALTLMPATLLFGAILPLALALHCNDGQGVRHKFGFAYAGNTLAAIIGGVVAAIWLVPNYGSNFTLTILSSAPLVAALILIPKLRAKKMQLPAYAVLAGLMIVGPSLPGVSFKSLFSYNHYRFDNSDPALLQYFSEGQTGVVSLMTHHKEGIAYLKRNGITDGGVVRTTPYRGNFTHALTGALPCILQAKPSNALVIGFGTGITSRILSECKLESIKTIEIEPKVVEAMMQLNPTNFPFLADGSVQVEYAESRAYLRSDPNKYSIIASSNSRVGLIGSTNHYSQAYFQLVKSHLKDKGVFALSFSLFRMDVEILKSILHTFYSVFPEGAVFGNLSQGELILLGGTKPMALDYERSQTFLQKQKVAEVLRYGGLYEFSKLPTYFLFSSKQAKSSTVGAQIITDSNLLIETNKFLNSKKLPLGKDDPYHFINKNVQNRFSRVQP